MINVRLNCFETNSSSTHSMVIAHEKPTHYPHHVHFGIGEYGWGFDILRSVEDKAAYLFTSICCMSNKQDIKEAKEQLTASLAIKGISCDFDIPIYDNIYEFLENGYIDHCGTDEHWDWVKEMLTNPDSLFRFLFSNKSYVVTGNDNCSNEQYYELANPPYKHTTYYKGN